MEDIGFNKEDFERLKYFASSSSDDFGEFDDDFEEEYFEDFQIDEESLEDLDTIDEEDLKKERDEALREDFYVSEEFGDEDDLFGEEFDEGYDDEKDL